MTVLLLLAAQSVDWTTDYEAALKRSAATGKPVVVHFWGEN